MKILGIASALALSWAIARGADCNYDLHTCMETDLIDPCCVTSSAGYYSLVHSWDFEDKRWSLKEFKALKFVFLIFITVSELIT